MVKENCFKMEEGKIWQARFKEVQKRCTSCMTVEKGTHKPFTTRLASF